MRKLNSRTESLIHFSMLIVAFVTMSYFMNFYYKNYYMFTVYILSFVFYSSKILLIKYNPSRVILIRYLDYLVFGIFILQTILIRISIYIENFYIQADKYLFPFFYCKIIISSIWPLGIAIFMLFHLLNKQINRPILFIVSYLVIIFSYLYFFFN
jgi:hypothetical protein